MYNHIIKEQERRGFIEKNDSPPTTGPVHYIPHHHVSKDSKTTPIRIVYECSCRLSDNHPSLNDCLEIGPSLVNDLCSILATTVPCSQVREYAASRGGGYHQFVSLDIMCILILKE